MEMKKLIFVICVVFVGCSEKEPTCVTCFQDGVEVYSACLSDYPSYANIEDIRNSIDPIFVGEECHYHN